MKTDFKPGDKVEFCGIKAKVVSNYGSSGIVEVSGEGRMTWRWIFEGAKVKLVKKEALMVDDRIKKVLTDENREQVQSIVTKAMENNLLLGATENLLRDLRADVERYEEVLRRAQRGGKR